MAGHLMVHTRSLLGLVTVAAAIGAGVPVMSAAPPLKLVPYASGFTAPLGFVQDPTDPQVQFVVEKNGVIRTLVAGVVQATPFLDLTAQVTTDSERGLLGLAFPPDAATSGRFYVNYTDRPGGNTVVARYTRSTPLVANPASAFPLMWSTGERFIRQDFANHNGGCLAFGSDGFLYIGMGDGGSGNDPNRRAQDPNSLLGKMLRIDVNVPATHPTGFVVPANNPFLSNGAFRPELWDIGMRNPWRFSFDTFGPGATGALIIGDVGQNNWEEIDWEPRQNGARNYGWVIREGANPTPGISGVLPAFTPLMEPVWQYSHAVGASVTGGYMYRGASMPAYRSRYFFADFVTGHVYSAAVTVDSSPQGAAISDVVDHTPSFDTATRPLNVSSFGIDAAGEIYVVDYSRGAVLRIAQARPSAPTNLHIIR